MSSEIEYTIFILLEESFDCLWNSLRCVLLQMPSFDTELNELETVYASNITSLVLAGKTQFDDITATVETQAAPVIDSKIQSLLVIPS